LAGRGADLTVFTTAANGPAQGLGPQRSLDVPTDRPVSVDGVQVRYFRRSPLARLWPFHAPALGRAAREEIVDYDVVYCCATWTYPFFAAARAAFKAGIPYVISPMGAFMTRSLQEKWLKKQLYYRLAERRLTDRSTCIRCTSLAEQDQLRARALQPAQVVIPEALDLAPFADLLPNRGRLRASLGLPADALVSLFVGRLAPEKQIERTVDAFAQGPASLPNAHLLLVGPDAGSGPAIRRRIVELGLDARVHLLGLLEGESLLQAYAEADLLVLLSRRENFGMVVVEAMACGLPVLVSEQVGLAKEVRQAGAGRVVAAQIERIASAWCEMLTGNERPAMGERGRELARQRFSSDVVTAQMLDLLRRAAEGSLATGSLARLAARESVPGALGTAGPGISDR
jgi:glycosyltransferase involved in cell wall biosynthesis